METSQAASMVYKLDDKPPVLVTALVAIQHLLAVFGGILTAPLIIALGMGLSVEQTSYLISSALVVSGFATAVQILRAGPLPGDMYIGSGLLSIQGTSFAFVGPLIFSYQTLVTGMDPDTALGMIFGSCAVCALVMMVISQFIGHLRKIVTSNVTGATIILLGISLIVVTLQNLQREYQSAGDEGWMVILLAGAVFAVILLVSRSNNTWLRLCSISIGLLLGLVLSFMFGAVDLTVLDRIDTLFLPVPWHQPLAIDWPTVLLLMPIFLVSATESIGDFTATSDLSGVPVGDGAFWQRIKGGVLADALNSFVAAIFCTFPNTTFSQNNGVIRLTGVCSRYVGFYIAGLLALVGIFPIIGGIFQAIPGAVIYGATLLMFGMVALAGVGLVKAQPPTTRDWSVVAIAIACGYGTSIIAPGLGDILPASVNNVIAFPVSTGALFAVILELLIPKSKSENA